MNTQTLRPFSTALLNPCVDPSFKSLFTTNSRASHQALTFFLSDMLGKEVTNVELQPNELAIESKTDKQAEFDIACKLDGEAANIEMQGRNDEDDYGKRTEYHVAHLLNHYMPKGKDWADTPKVYQISVLNFVFDKKEKNCFNHYLMRNSNGRIISERLNVIFLELPKVAPLEDNVKKLTVIEMWGKFFLYANKPEKQFFIEELEKANRGIQMAVRVLKNISQDEINWWKETRYWMHVSDEKTRINSAKRKGLAEGREEGRAEGHAEGFAQGHAEGHAEGRAEGIAEGKTEATINAIKNFYANKTPIEVIATSLNMTIEQVQKIVKD